MLLRNESKPCVKTCKCLHPPLCVFCTIIFDFDTDFFVPIDTFTPHKESVHTNFYLQSKSKLYTYIYVI